jgi:uncharacterized protein YndB with AHSA1/START domain
MTTPPALPPLNARVTVGMSAERAFDLFTRSFNSWWPAQYHIGEADLAEAVIEPHPGGRWYERGVDGAECDWGRVLTWEPPHRLVLTWQIDGRWQFDPEPANASRIEVRFTPDGPEQTTVEIEHSGLEHLVAGQAMRDALVNGGDWRAVLDLFAKAAADQQ